MEQLPIGNFELKVEGKGFQTALHPAFELVLNQVARIDVQMIVGAMSQSVEVVGTTPLLQTDTTDISTHIDHVVTENGRRRAIPVTISTLIAALVNRDN